MNLMHRLIQFACLISLLSFVQSYGTVFVSPMPQEVGGVCSDVIECKTVTIVANSSVCVSCN